MAYCQCIGWLRQQCIIYQAIHKDIAGKDIIDDATSIKTGVDPGNAQSVFPSIATRSTSLRQTYGTNLHPSLHYSGEETLWWFWGRGVITTTVWRCYHHGTHDVHFTLYQRHRLRYDVERTKCVGRVCWFCCVVGNLEERRTVNAIKWLIAL